MRRENRKSLIHSFRSIGHTHTYTMYSDSRNANGLGQLGFPSNSTFAIFNWSNYFSLLFFHFLWKFLIFEDWHSAVNWKWRHFSPGMKIKSVYQISLKRQAKYENHAVFKEILLLRYPSKTVWYETTIWYRTQAKKKDSRAKQWQRRKKPLWIKRKKMDENTPTYFPNSSFIS